MEEFFRWLGQQVGAAIRFVVELFSGAFVGVDDFFTGLSESLGMGVSVINIALLLLGLYLVYAGVRKFLRRRLVGGVVRFGLAILLLGWLIH